MNAPATIRALIDAQAEHQPDAIYAMTPDGATILRYRELRDGCRRIAGALARHGAPAGSTISLVMGNGLQTIRLLLGALYGGYAVNPVNLVSQPEQIRYVLDHADAHLVCVAPDRIEAIRPLLATIARPITACVVDPDADVFPGEYDGLRAEAGTSARADDLGLLMYTSGTTGQPKGVMLSQANLLANAYAISTEHRLGRDDRVLAVLPLYHINAFAVTMLAPLAHGGSLVIPPRFSAGRFWPQALESRCTWINLVPTMISYLLEASDSPAPSTLTGIRFCRSASAALPPEHHRAFEQRFGIGIIETMGLTETVAPAFSNPIDPGARKLASVGRASGCEARVCNEAGLALPDGETGEIQIRGPQVMQGYYKNPSATAAAFGPEGWLRTGDLGHRDADGFFFVTGRIKELIIKGGENIAPREIDEALMRHPAVLEAAAVGVPDRHYGQQVAVAIVLREAAGATGTADAARAADAGTADGGVAPRSTEALVAIEAELRAYSETVLGRYKTPAAWRFVNDLPRGPSGKVQRLKLIALFDPPQVQTQAQTQTQTQIQG